MTTKPFDTIDFDSMNLLNEMELISSSLKKTTITEPSAATPEASPEINEFLMENNLSETEEISRIPSFKNDALQIKRLRDISATFTENLQKQFRGSSFVSTDDGCYESAQEDVFNSGSENAFKNINENVFNQGSEYAFNQGNDDAFKQGSDDDFVQSRISSSVIQRIIVSDENNNSRHLSREEMFDENEDCNNTIILAPESLSGSDFNSSFSVGGRDSDKRTVSDVSDGSANKFRASRIISPSHVYTLSPVLPLSEQFGSDGKRKSSLMQALDVLSPGSAYSVTFDSDFARNTVDANRNETVDTDRNETVVVERKDPVRNLNKSRQILQSIQRRVTSDILLPKEDQSKRIASNSSLKNELEKVWETFIGDDTFGSTFGDDKSNLGKDESNFGKDESNFGEDGTHFGPATTTTQHIWHTSSAHWQVNGEQVQPKKVKPQSALKFESESEMPIQRTSTGLGIYHGGINQSDASNKQFAKGNVLELLTKNGVSLVDNSLVYHSVPKDDLDQENEYNFRNDYGIPSTPKQQNTATWETKNTRSKNKISSPVKIVEPKQQNLPPKRLEHDIPAINLPVEDENVNKCLKLKDSNISSLGYLYFSLDTLSLSNFVVANNPNLTFKDKNCELQILFDNGKKVVESEWLKLNDSNSKKVSFVDLTSQEFATEVPVKDVLKNTEDTIFELQITLKLKYEQPKSKTIEIQDRVPVNTMSGGSADAPETDRSNSLTKLFKKGNKQRQSPRKMNVEYQTITKRIVQKSPDPWSGNFAPDSETFATVTVPINLDFIQNASHKIRMETGIVKSVLDGSKKVGLLSFKTLHLEKTSHILPKSISAIQTILEKKDRVIESRYSGVLYQQGLDLGETVKRRYFELKDGNLVGSTSGEVKLVVNLENVDSILVDCECPLPGYNFELVFGGESSDRLVLSCDTSRERREWLARISALLEILRIVREIDI